MSEQIVVFEVGDPEDRFAYDRDKFYAEQIEAFKSGGKPTRGCHTVEVFLFNEYGEVFVQKRSKSKAHNAWLLDKSMGGHLQDGDGMDYTVMVETVQELQAPSIVVKDQDWLKAFGVLKEYLHTVATVKKLGTMTDNFPKIIDGEEIVICNRKHVYVGVYAGAVKTVDREASGILQYSLPQLREEMEKFPEAFTQDLHMLIAHFQQDLSEFVDFLKANESA